MMVCWGVFWKGFTPIHFCSPRVRTTDKIYEETVLESVVKPLNDTLGSSNKILHRRMSRNVVNNGSRTVFQHLVNTRQQEAPTGIMDCGEFWSEMQAEYNKS